MPLELPASKALICATLPESVTVCVPELVTMTPVVPAETARTPPYVSVVTDRVAVTVAESASTSAIDKPVPCSVRAVCSVAL